MSQELSNFILRIKELLHYDPITGNFTNKISRGNVVAGSTSGGFSDGYIYISIDNVRYLAHRLAWLYVYGVWPDNTIDHIDNNGSNNAISNLRDATYAQNNYNRLSQANCNIYRGVYKSLNKYAAHIKVLGVTEYLGTYATAEEASFVYEVRAKEIQGEFYKDPEYTYKLDKPPVPSIQKYITGYTGVRQSGSKFRAVIKINGKNVDLGTYLTAELASEAFQNKKKEIGRV